MNGGHPFSASAAINTSACINIITNTINTLCMETRLNSKQPQKIGPKWSWPGGEEAIALIALFYFFSEWEVEDLYNDCTSDCMFARRLMLHCNWCISALVPGGATPRGPNTVSLGRGVRWVKWSLPASGLMPYGAVEPVAFESLLRPLSLS